MSRFRMRPLRANNVLDLYQQRSLINLDPPYQRLSIWDQEKQQRFIDSVVNGVDTPKLYFHEIAKQAETPSPNRFSVIDGKQRLIALWAFISNEITLPTDFVYFDNESYQAAGLTYNQLLSRYPLLRARFDNFEVPVILVQADKDELIEQLFWRLNVQVPLSAPERRNVLGGPLPFLIRKVGLTPFFRESVLIRNDRFQHYDLAAKFIYICHTDGFVSIKKVNLDNFVQTMKRAHENGEEVASEAALAILEQRTKDELERAHSFFGSNNPLLRSVGRVTLYFHIFRLCTKTSTALPLSLSMLEKFNADVTSARHKSQRMSGGSGEVLDGVESDLVQFDREKQSPNDGTALERQYGYLRSYMENHYQIDLPAV